ncbi:hypothetical protein [Allorhodopirellula solitaria]|uniref:Uncharacterized protein n=1 Tax=Allorhodopirellula solitaria TaxID=2527987 RepID=A0A5C5XSY5_9BACT|nr:hypothetical protein [Allorhodopirellula solitaria]TWT66366.1 hypothetical protein CA85_24600 [Allorhodopirellula solitaria]
MAKRRNTGPGISFFAFQDIITAVVGIFILITLILVLQLAQRVEAASEAVPQDIQPIVDTIAELRQQISQIEAEIAERSAAGSQTAGLNKFNIAEKVEQLKSENARLAARIETSRSKQSELKKLAFVALAESEKLAKEAASLSKHQQELNELAQQTAQLQSKQKALRSDDSTIFRDQTDEGTFLVLITVSPETIRIRDGLLQTEQILTGTSRIDQWKQWLAEIPLSRRHLLLRIRPGGERDFRSMKSAADAADAAYGFTVVGMQEAARFAHEVGELP